MIAYSVAERTREIGIRMALRATGDRILGDVVRTGAVMGLMGVVLGSLAAFALNRRLEGFVWGVSTLDPATFGTVAVLLILVSVVASLVPARRAVRLNPVTALRE